MLNVALTGTSGGENHPSSNLFRMGSHRIDADASPARRRRRQRRAGSDRRRSEQRAGPGRHTRPRGIAREVMGDDAPSRRSTRSSTPPCSSARLELQQTARERGDAIVVNDIPLLFEVLDPAQFDAIVLVDAPVALRRTRLRACGDCPTRTPTG